MVRRGNYATDRPTGAPVMDMADLTSNIAAFPDVCRILLRRAPFAEPQALRYDAITEELHCTVADVSFTLTALRGDPRWLIDAARLGGLHLRCMPHPEPDRVTLGAFWEGQFYTLSGVAST